MKKTLSALFACAFAFCVAVAQENIGVFSLAKSGAIDAEKVGLHFFARTANGTEVDLSAALSAGEGYPKTDLSTMYTFEGSGNVEGIGAVKIAYDIIFREDATKAEITGNIDIPESAGVKEVYIKCLYPYKTHIGKLQIDNSRAEFYKPNEVPAVRKMRTNSFSVIKGDLKVAVYSWQADMSFALIDGGKTVEYRMFLPKRGNKSYYIGLDVRTERLSSLDLNLVDYKKSEYEIKYFPVGLEKFGKVTYAISNTKDNYIACMSVEPKSSVKVDISPDDGSLQNLYLLNGFDTANALGEAAVASVDVKYADGTTSSYEIKGDETGSILDPKHSKKRAMPWNYWISDTDKKGVYTTSIELEAKPVASIEFKNLAGSPWKIFAGAFASEKYSVKKLMTYYMAPSKEYFPFDFDPTTQKGSALDFSQFLDAPAGKYGYIKRDGDRLYFEKAPEKTVKFFGGNLCEWSCYMKTRGEIIAMAEAYARLGFNIVRLHHYDRELVDMNSPDGTGLDKEKLDRLEFLVSELKKRGIYVEMDLFISRVIKPSAVPAGFRYLTHPSAGKAYFLASEQGLENWKSVVRNLMTHVNPYTGMAWKDDPQIVQVCLVNESRLYHCSWVLKDYFNAQYNKWLAENKITETPENKEFVYQKFADFYEWKTYSKMSDFVRKELGMKALISNQNHHVSYPMALSRSRYDMIEAHSYYGHPVFIGASWRLPAKVASKSSILQFCGTPVSCADEQVYGYPFSMTEWNYSPTCENAAEGGLLGGAYNALNGTDMICNFQYSCQYFWAPNVITYFSTRTDPISSVSLRAAVLMMLRGDVRESKTFVPLMLARDYLDRPSADKAEELDSLRVLTRPLALYGKPMHYITDKIQDVKLPENAAPFAVTSEAGWSKVDLGRPAFRSNSEAAFEEIRKLTNGAINTKTDIYKSSTGELTLNRKRQTFTAVTPKTEAFVLAKNGRVKGKFFSEVSTEDANVSILVSAIDGAKTLSESKRMVIFNLSSVKNNSMHYSDRKRTILLGMGWKPLLARAAKTKVTVDADLTGFKLYAITADGKKLGEVPMTFVDGKTLLELNTRFEADGKAFAAFAYELVKED